MSDDPEVRAELIRQATPNRLTSFFAKRPCIAIITPYVLLIIFAVITIMGDVFKMDLMDDSWLINDHQKVVNRDIMNVVQYGLNRKEAKIDAKKEELEADQVRFGTTGLNTILVMYDDKDKTSAGGLLSKKTMQKVIEIEHEIISWAKKSKNFKNAKFNDNEIIAWHDICFAGKDAESDPRTGKSKCNDYSYNSAVSLF